MLDGDAFQGRPRQGDKLWSVAYGRGCHSMLDKIIAASCAVYVALSAWSVTTRGDLLPPVAMLVMVLTMSVLLLGHMWKHLGWRLIVAFFAVASAVEWIFEETNIRNGGFIWGDLRYGDITVFSVHLGSVPLVVPILMAVILWPTYAVVNLALDGRVVVEPRAMTWWQNVWRCVLYGFVHSWMMLMCNELCVKWGVYRWVGHSAERPAADMFLGDPSAPGGWLIYVVAAMLVFTFVMIPLVGRDSLAKAARRRLAWSDGAPIVFWGVLALQNYFNPVNNATVANVVLWTMGFFAAFVGYRFVDLMRTQNRDNSPTDADVSPRPAPAHHG
ncbi:hypothetical protein [Mycobacterium intracellulare]|uniref:Uncharacterized protein n=3 Tax=Mycobacterium TaxID=1763 RepID=A0ABT7P8K5_MYCIT|nr:hypothetical protein [Mycobacterium intracellulare]MDM3929620.1 hypothetical protein [Mycobacterium intracellulare subsp. chimaera]UCN11585.1 hypothetical protein LFT50_11060 [Mycobacterium intracellulare subsp. chimaera]